MKKIVLLIFFVLLVPTTIFGQYRLQHQDELNSFNSIPKENVFIHFNDNFLLCGEYLYYKFYCLDAENRTPSEISKIGYVALLGKDDTLIFEHKIKLVDGLGQGDFFIPVDIQTGHYKLIGFTQWMRNEGEQSFFSEDLVIINPYQELPNTGHKSSKEVLAHSRAASLVGFSISEEKTKALKIKLPQRTFGKRQLVKFDLQEMTEQGMCNLSISVRKKDSVVNPFQKKRATTLETDARTRKERELKPNDSIYLPELRGELISGRIISQTSKLSAANENISLSIAGDDGLTKVSRSNENGAFYFNLDTGNRNNQMFFDILGTDKEELQIILDSTPMNSNSFTFKEMVISPELNPIIEQRSIYNQIENAFFEQKEDGIISSAHAKPAFQDFQEIYNLDAYTRFLTLQETIVEIIEDVQVKKRKGQYVIQVRGKDQFFINSADAPLLLVDNILVQDATQLFNYDVKKIQRIGISRNEFYIGPKKYQGIFSVETKNGDFSTTIPSKKRLICEISGPIVMKKYYEQEYSKTSLESTKYNADFRQQLLWLPNLKMGKIGTFQFYTSDNAGTYEISVEGFSENGEPLSILEKIYVE